MQPTRKDPPNSRSWTETWITVGTIGRAHGVRGELRLHPHGPVDEIPWETGRFALISPNDIQPVKIASVRPISDALLIQFADINDRTVAQELTGAHFAMHIDDLPPLAADNAYLFELVGAKAVDAKTQTEIGTITEFLSNGAQRLLAIQQGDKELLHPLLEDTIVTIDRAAKIVSINVIPGLFDDI
jgi:16S rRNA processing protein RimM